MDPFEQLAARIREAVVANHADIAAAMTHLLKAPPEMQREPWWAFEGWAERLVVPPDETNPVLLDGPSAREDEERAVRYLSLRRAAALAVWELVRLGRLIPDAAAGSKGPRVEVRAGKVGGSRQHLAGLGNLIPGVPAKCEVVYEREAGPFHDAFTRGDLFLDDLGIPDLDRRIAAALKEAATCFRHLLMTPCLAMLDAASDGSWTLAAAALCRRDEVPESICAELKKAFSKDGNMPKLVEGVTKAIRHGGVAEGLGLPSTVKVDVDRTARWALEVRDARNVLHWNAAPRTPNTYDKVALLVLGAAPAMRTLSAIRMMAATDAL